MSITLTIEGMHCEHCEETVRGALETVDGVTSAAVDRDTGRATVDGAVDPGRLVAAVEDAGYEASV